MQCRKPPTIVVHLIFLPTLHSGSDINSINLADFVIGIILRLASWNIGTIFRDQICIFKCIQLGLIYLDDNFGNVLQKERLNCNKFRALIAKHWQKRLLLANKYWKILSVKSKCLNFGQEKSPFDLLVIWGVKFLWFSFLYFLSRPSRTRASPDLRLIRNWVFKCRQFLWIFKRHTSLWCDNQQSGKVALTSKWNPESE